MIIMSSWFSVTDIELTFTYSIIGKSSDALLLYKCLPYNVPISHGFIYWYLWKKMQHSLYDWIHVWKVRTPVLSVRPCLCCKINVLDPRTSTCIHAPQACDKKRFCPQKQSLYDQNTIVTLQTSSYQSQTGRQDKDYNNTVVRHREETQTFKTPLQNADDSLITTGAAQLTWGKKGHCGTVV